MRADEMCAFSTSPTTATKQAVRGKPIWKKKIILLPKGLKIATR